MSAEKPGWIADQDYLENPKWVAGFPRLARYGFGFEFMAFSNHMRTMARLAQKNPGIPIFIEHAGMPFDHTPEGIVAWRDGMRALAEAPNVVCKISGLGNTIPNWTEASIRRYVLDAIEFFGIDRCMFASNAREPVAVCLAPRSHVPRLKAAALTRYEPTWL